MTIPRSWFPYFAQDPALTIDVTKLELYDGDDVTKHHGVGSIGAATAGLAANPSEFTITSPPDAAGAGQILTRSARSLFLIVRYTLS